MTTWKNALIVKTQKERAAIIGTFIDQSPIGALSGEDTEIFHKLFETYYTPDDGEYKYGRDDIATVAIYWNEDHGFVTRSKCFNLLLHIHAQRTEKERYPVPVSRKRLSGANRTSYANLMKALRDVIQPQIHEFRETFPLNSSDICPIMNTPLGMDAQVDHDGKTFQQLTEEWRNQNPGVKPKHHSSKHSLYTLDEPYLASWYQYHQDHAILRWLSYEGNKIAHRV
jgi:hypothetical protein